MEAEAPRHKQPDVLLSRNGDNLIFAHFSLDLDIPTPSRNRHQISFMVCVVTFN